MTDLLEDWIEGRSDKTYVSRFDKVSLGWEDSVLPSEGYSSLIYKFKGDTSVTEVITRAYAFGRTRLESMGLFDTRLHIVKDVNATDGKTIYAGTFIFDNKDLSIGARVDVFLGLIVHEAAHVLYTDFSFIESIAKNPIKKTLWNIVEDEYIEREIGKEFPGYTNYLAATKSEILGEVVEGKEKNELSEIINTILLFVRYPKALDMDLVVKHHELLAGIKLLFDGKYPESTEECVEMAEALYDILKEYYEKPPESEGGGEGESSDESSESGEGSKDTVPELPSPKSGLPDSLKDGEEGEIPEGPKDLEKDFDLDKITKVLSKLSSHLDDTEEKELDTSSKIKETKLLDIDGRIDLEDKNVICIPMTTGNAKKYQELKKEVAPKIGSLANYLKFDTFRRTRVQKSLRHGKLDTGKLVEGFSGDDKIYTKKSRAKVKGGVFGLLLDESGSMGAIADKSRGKTRMDIAIELAVLFKEALKRTNLNSFVYGHSGDNYGGSYVRERVPKAVARATGRPTFLNIYQENNRDVHPYAITNSKQRSQNRDGLAIFHAVKRIRSQVAKDHIYMIVISDGSPCAGNYSGASAINDTRDKIKEAERKFNATIIGVGINVSYNMGSMYSRYVNFNNLNTFVQDTGKLIRKIINKNY